MAEFAARKLGLSGRPSSVTALDECLERKQTRKITARLMEIYSEEPANLDPALASAQSKSIERDSE